MNYMDFFGFVAFVGKVFGGWAFTLVVCALPVILSTFTRSPMLAGMVLVVAGLFALVGFGLTVVMAWDGLDD